MQYSIKSYYNIAPGLHTLAQSNVLWVTLNRTHRYDFFDIIYYSSFDSVYCFSPLTLFIYCSLFPFYRFYVTPLIIPLGSSWACITCDAPLMWLLLLAYVILPIVLPLASDSSTPPTLSIYLFMLLRYMFLFVS